MTSPDHKARLAVVVPATDSRGPPQGQNRQHAFNVLDNGLPRPNGFTFSPPVSGPAPVRQTGPSTPRKQNGIPPQQQSNRVNPSQRPNGFIPQQQSDGSLSARPRLLNVDEALQFSPFSSIVPFSSDVIPTPNANLPGSQHLFWTPPELSTARQPIDFLNEELSRSQGKSSIVQNARRDIKSYLNHDKITKFKFKEPAKLNCTERPPHGKSNTNSHAQDTPGVSPFADMMLHATDLAHRYPTPTSPEETSPKPMTKTETRRSASFPKFDSDIKLQQPRSTLPISHKNLQSLQEQSPVTPTIHRFTNNETAYSQNARLSANSLQVHTPQKQPMVIIPPSSAQSRQSDFVTIEEPLRVDNIEASRKRKRESGAHVGEILTQTKDQRAASDDTLHQFQDLILDIFEADDQSQADASGFKSSTGTHLFVSVCHGDREINTLAPVLHVKLESHLHKIINLKRLKDIPMDHLQRLQSLCEGALTFAESSDLDINPDWNADDFAAWIQGLDAVDVGLRSARTIIRIMTGGREEKEIYSEELLQSVLSVVKKVLDRCVTPIVEARNSGPTSALYEAASSHKKVISQLLYDATKVMGLLATLLAKVDMAENIITGIEYFATPLLFVENAHSEKDSVLGVQKFESLRRTAMDMIAIIFSRYPEQRLFLFDEILTSLQKLPVSRQHARQYKLADGTSIQLVSALIMRLIQTSATHSTATIKGKASRKVPLSSDAQRDESDSSAEDSLRHRNAVEGSNDTSDSDDTEEPRHHTAMQLLNKDASFLFDNAARSAQYVVKHLISRAMTASKTGDQPHRQLLDIFVGDLIAVLHLPEWPGAELLLYMLLASCRNIAETPKSAAPAKNMALELLGMMGSAISELVSIAGHAAKSLENHESEFSGYLRQMLDDYTEGSLEKSEVVMWHGPYHAVVDYLEYHSSDDPQTISALDYYLTRWARAASSGDLKSDFKTEILAVRLRKMLSGAEWFASDSRETISNSQKRIAYALTLLTMEFCRQFEYILKILLDSVTSEQITVRTRSLKSVTQMLEKDPSLLDRGGNVKILIGKCATDASSMVRDSALTLIGKCIALKPTLEQDFLRHILRLTDDPATGVRKRSMRLLKDIYLRNSGRDIKTAIGDSLLQRVRDLDASVSEIARQTFEEIWLSPFRTSADSADVSAGDKVSLQEQVSLIVRTVQRSEKVPSVLVHLLKDVLSSTSKNAAANFKVCKSLVATAFDIMIDNTNGQDRLEQRHILQTLTVFAKANARLFTADQLQRLQPYISDLSGKDDLNRFRSIVIIFRCVLPVLSTVQHGLLREIQTALIQSVSKLGKSELNEVAECLWTINGTLQNPEVLLKLIVSVLQKLHTLGGVTFVDSSQNIELKRVKKYIQIAGYFGKHCDFEIHGQIFQNALAWWKGGSVARLIVQSVNPFTNTKQPLSLRAEAFDSIGLICQSWPYQFTQEHISNAFQDVLRNGEPELQNNVLSSFRDFFAKIESQSEAKGEPVVAGADASNGGKLGGSMTASDGDGASALIAQRFLKDVLSIALASQDTSALTATEVIASINRQGLVHPKESGPALVALETSINPAIAHVALQEHRILHQQHESMFEREYMRAIQEAFRYQKEIVGDTLGYTTQPYASKLHGMFEIIKTSKGKYQKKFLSNFCSKIDFEPAKMDLSGSPPNTLQMSRFLIENLAFFDYSRLDELQYTISCMEKIVADTGSGVAHSISTEVFHITVEPEKEVTDGVAPPEQDSAINPAIDPSRLRELTTASIILSSLWEARTYLRRLYGLSASQQRKENKTKAAAKDLNKAPSRVQGVTGDKLIAAIAEDVNSLSNEELMMRQCQEFLELLSVDSEVKVATEGDEEPTRPETPSGDEEQDAPMSGGLRALKRKGSVSIAGTPMKKKRGRPSLGNRKKSGKSHGSDEDWD